MSLSEVHCLKIIKYNITTNLRKKHTSLSFHPSGMKKYDEEEHDVYHSTWYSTVYR